jgi:hypothetical protein
MRRTRNLFERRNEDGNEGPGADCMSTNEVATAARPVSSPRAGLFYDRAYPPDLRAAELACIKRRREQSRAGDYSPTDPEVPGVSADVQALALPADTVGLALSGGGIRSATFCLGILQALATEGLLRRVDFLSTVSGGGYIGAFLGGLIQRRDPIDPGGPIGVGRAERDLRTAFSTPVQWLREHGRYMSPNGAGDEITAGAVYLRNLCAIHIVLAILVLTLLAAATLLRGAVDARWSEQLPPWDGAWLPWSPYFLLSLAMVGVISFPLGWSYWFIQRDKNRQLSDWVAAPTALLIAVASCVVLWRFTLDETKVIWALRFFAFTPLLALAAWGVAWIKAKLQVGVDVEVFARSKLSQWLAGSLVAAGAIAAFALVDTLGQAMYTWFESNTAQWSLKGGGAVGAVAALLAAISKLAPLLGDEQGGRHLSLPKNLLAGVAAAAVLGWILVSLSALTHMVAWYAAPGPPHGMNIPALSWLTLSAGVLSVLCGRTIRFINSSSHQALYGNRLTRAYLGASNKNRFSDKSGQRLSDPIRGDNIGWGLYAPFQSGGPLHIVNVTLNETVLGASQVEQRDRKGLPMAVGPCGLSGGIESHGLWKQASDDPATGAADWRGRLPGDSTDWIKPLPRPEGAFHLFGGTPPVPHEIEALNVGTWTAISGAAFTTGLGARTSLALSLLLGVANVRLGYWWNSHVKPDARAAVRTAPTFRNRVGEQINAWFPVQTHLFQEFTARFFGPNRQRWYLSDGGHFENTACYELLRRRVPFIIACDDGQDAAYTFEDLANLVRKARTDLCADIRFLSRSDIETLVEPSFHGVIGVLDDFRTAKEGDFPAGLAQAFARAHAVLANVYYEESAEPGSVILFVKPSVTGDEPLDVLQYRQQHRAFPQEPTVDQYFDEAQWESYRALGEHVGSLLFRTAEGARGWSPSAMIRP